MPFPYSAFPGRAGCVGLGYQHAHSPEEQNLVQSVSQGTKVERGHGHVLLS